MSTSLTQLPEDMLGNLARDPSFTALARDGMWALDVFEYRPERSCWTRTRCWRQRLWRSLVLAPDLHFA